MVKPGPADQNRPLARLQKRLDLAVCLRFPLCEIAALRPVPNAKEVMRHRLAFALRRLRGEDRQVVVKLHGVGIDHLATQALRQGNGQPGFACRSRPEEIDRSHAASSSRCKCRKIRCTAATRPSSDSSGRA